jgi:hypothetical protein
MDRFEDVDWIHLAHDGVRWSAHVNTVMNLRISRKARSFLSI